MMAETFFGSTTSTFFRTLPNLSYFLLLAKRSSEHIRQARHASMDQEREKNLSTSSQNLLNTTHDSQSSMAWAGTADLLPTFASDFGHHGSTLRGGMDQNFLRKAFS
jgi:hypothetical protein